MRNIIFVFTFLFYLRAISALYEDQIGKFDWKKELIGNVENVVYETSLSVSKYIFVSTTKNVIACLSTRTGLIVWRKTLLSHDGKVTHMLHSKDGLLTVTKLGLARVWDSNTGILKLEINFASTVDHGVYFSILDVAILERSYTEGNLLVVLSSAGLHSASMMPARSRRSIQSASIDIVSIETGHNQIYVDSSNEKIILLQLQSGARLLSTVFTASDLNQKSQSRIDTTWMDDLHMAAVLEDGTLFYISQESGAVHLVQMETGAILYESTLNHLDISSTVSSVVVNKNKDIKFHGFDVMLLHENSQASLIKVKNQNSFQVLWTKTFPGLFSIDNILLAEEAYSFIGCSTPDEVKVVAVNLKSGDLDNNLEIKYKMPKQSGSLSKTFVNMFLKRNTPVGFRVLLTFGDRSSVLVSHPSKAVWRREEALASVVDAAMLDLPLSDGDAGIEAEFDDAENTKVFEMFIKRIKAQSNMFVSWTKQLLKDIRDENLFQHKTKDPLIQVEGMTRDPFSLHKMIVLVTECGALFGVDSLTGDIVWKYYTKKLDNRKLFFYLQRTTAHFPYPPQAVILGVDREQKAALIVMSVNPITGEATDLSDQYQEANAHLLQAVLAPFTDNHHLKPLVLLDSQMKLHYIPDTEEIRVLAEHSKLYVYDVNVSTNLIRGFSVRKSSFVDTMWSVKIPNTHKIVGVASKQAFEKIDSIGRPLADRSVIYKYLNPNLVAVLSESLDYNVDRSSLYLHVLDAVTGKIVYSLVHKKASGPVHIVHSENWIIYSYWNTKARRTELSSLEFYEGKNQYNSTAFSSFHSRPDPLAVQQAYIISTGIATIGVTRTEKALTSRQILFGLKSGSLFGLPRRFFDPRRPLTLTESHREEGLLQYAPEVPTPHELFLSYNLTLEDISSIYSSPAALESTSLILVTGLDIFFTRSQPSKMFDVLKEDFDYLLISAVLALMLVAAFVTRRMAQMKQLKKSWR